MELILDLLRRLPDYPRLRTALESAQAVGVSGAAQINRSHLIAALCRDTARPAVVVCQDEMAARRTQSELAAFLGAEAPILPTRDLMFYDASAISRGWEQQRLRCLYDLARGKTPLLLTTLEAFSLRTMPKAQLFSAAMRLLPGAQLELDELISRLVHAGYSRCSLVEGAGQFSVRGGIVDIFSPAEERPVRLEFFGDEIDTMGYFDPVTQRRVENADELVILPVAETLPALHPGGIEGLARELDGLLARQRRRKTPNEALMRTLQADADALRGGLAFSAADRYQALIYPEFACAADYLPAEALVFFCDHGNLRRSAQRAQEELGMMLDSLLQSGLLCGELCDFSADWEQLCGRVAGHGAAFFDSFLAASYPQSLQPSLLVNVTAKQLPSYGGNLDAAASDLAFYQKNDYASLVLCGNRRRGEILAQQLREKHLSAFLAFPLAKLPAPGQILLTDGALPFGMEYPDLRFAILTEGQLLAQTAQKPRKKHQKATNRQKLSSFTDLSPGDLIVHEYHGIGRYVGMEQIRVDGIVKDYVKIAYQGTDTLYVPATQLDLISKYIGGGEDTVVRLNKLSGDQWQKTKARAKSAAKDLAAGLIQLYAERRRRMGYAFAADTPWQAEFEDNFPYAETDDQLRCIEEIKADMESPQPMDRLLCGDVGFGKTEVALRAAMKAVLDGKQVAILVPTTVLAQQHYTTALNRFRGFPVNIGALSRFSTPQQQRKVLSDLRTGALDLVVGTHKLLQKDVEFHDLGLLIVDEEQRFGVTHKEKLKELARGVDVLTLSATPIPRTMQMSLSGVRDMSLILTPPDERRPVEVHVGEWDPDLVSAAIRRELARGGQVYYVSNRVRSIDDAVRRVTAAAGEARVGVAHGQMSKEELERVMEDFSAGELDVLVATTIIESGIDNPHTNTLIIEDSQRYGLAQMYQLKGRVGRSSTQAYAYFMFPEHVSLTEEAQARLTALDEHTDLGSGMRIAMRDLEIRGAGSLLGAEQSGNMSAVGFDLFAQMLNQAVSATREGDLKAMDALPPALSDITVNVPGHTYLPEEYVPDADERVLWYRRIASAATEQAVEDVRADLADKRPDMPQAAKNLLEKARIKAYANEHHIKTVSVTAGKLVVEPIDVPRDKMTGLRRAGGRYLADKRKLSLPLRYFKLDEGDNLLAPVAEFLEELAK